MRFLIVFMLLSTGSKLIAQSNALIPYLNSNPSASATVLLDFDGEVVRGTAWNWNGPIEAEKCGLSFTDLFEIFNRVAEDFRIFNLNITTDSTIYDAAPANKRIRIIVTPTYRWYGEAGGVSFIGSFEWGDDTPSWVFSTLLNNNVKFIAEAISHELGHCLGLQHHSVYNNCEKVNEYDPGDGDGQTAWAPIMGVSYYHNVSTWDIGPTTIDCNDIQDDISVISRAANGVGFIADDHPDLTARVGTPLHLVGSSYSSLGTVNSSSDQDAYSFVISKPSAVSLVAAPSSVGSGNEGANVDLKVSLFDSAFRYISSYDPDSTLNAGVDTSLAAGSYYIVVEGVGNRFMPDYASVGSYSLILTVLHALPVTDLTLIGKTHGRSHQLLWNYFSDEPIMSIELQSSVNGTTFASTATFPINIRSYTVKKPLKDLVYYRLRLQTKGSSQYYYSNIVALKSAPQKEVQLLGTVIHDYAEVRLTRPGSYWLYSSSGILIQQGHLNAGYNTIPVKAPQGGPLWLKIQSGNEISSYTLIKQ